MTRYGGYWKTVGIGLDCFVNAILGGRAYDTLSARCGRSIIYGGWASRVWWPEWWVQHCLWAARPDPEELAAWFASVRSLDLARAKGMDFSPPGP